VRDLLNQGIPGEVIRFVLLSTHYSKPMDWTQKKADEATTTLRKWHELVADIIPGKLDVALLERVANDINTPGALTRLHELAKTGDLAGLLAGARFLGLLSPGTDWWRPQVVPSEIMLQIQNLVEARSAAKAGRDFAKADTIRDKLSAAGVEIIDKPNGISETIITSRLKLDQIG
jgi:cysteinyl-tRNA synthetase